MKPILTKEFPEAPADGEQYARQDGEWTVVGSVFIGVYDQTADLAVPPNGPLAAATTFASGSYYTLTQTGNFVSTQPGIPTGQPGSTGDQIVATSGGWVHVGVGQDYLSAVVNDNAKGVITFDVGAKTDGAIAENNDVSSKAYVDQQDAAHVADPNPHDQYTLETDALQIFSFAAYGGMRVDSPVPFPDLGLTYQVLDIFDELNVTTPRGVTVDLPSGTMAVDNDGVYLLTISGVFEHNSSNQGRTTTIRLFNVTLGAEAFVMVLGTGRNAEATSVNYTTLAEITEAQKGHVFRLEIGGGDSYSLVEWGVLDWNLMSVGEWREPLPSDP